MNKDNRLLEEAYNQVLLNEFDLKKALAGAAVGASLAASPMHAADADTVNKDYHLDKKPAAEQTGVNPYIALTKSLRGEELTPEEVSAIANDREYSAEYIQHLVNRGKVIPDVITKKYPDIIQQAKALAKQSASGG